MGAICDIFMHSMRILGERQFSRQGIYNPVLIVEFFSKIFEISCNKRMHDTINLLWYIVFYK